MKAVILAGGFGTRLRDVVSDVPKPMASIMGKPFLEHQLLSLKKQGINEVIITTHYMADKIKSYFGTGHRLGMDIVYSEEDVPLGTGGAIKNAERYIDDTFFVLNGDSYSDLNLREFMESHKQGISEGTINLIESEDPSHYGSVELEGDKVVAFSEKTDSSKGLINTGIYVFEPTILSRIPSGRSVSLEKEIFPDMVKEGRLKSHVHKGYFIDIGRPETYEQFKMDVLEKVYMNPEEDVRSAMKKMRELDTDLILVIDDQKKLFGVVTSRILGRHLEEGNLGDKLREVAVTEPITANVGDEGRISELLLSGIKQLPVLDEEGRVREVRFRVEEIRPKSFPIVRGKAPMRISFAGGGTDVPYFFEKYGGVVINSTIDKYCRATVVRRADNRIVINSDTGEEVLLRSNDLEYNGNYDLIKAIIRVVKPEFGFELHLHNDVPPGRGLGSSASLSVLVTKLLGELQGVNYSDEELARIAYKAETEELGIKGGWQDQYAAVTGGFSFMEFGKERTVIYPLRLKKGTIDELNSRLLLCYVGGTHVSGDVHSDQEKTFVENEEETKKRLENLKSSAIEIKNLLLSGGLESIGEHLHESWMNKKKASIKISNPTIDALYDIGRENGATGGKLLGAGGAGYLLFFHSPTRRNQLVRALEASGGKVMDFNFESEGVKTWAARS